MFKTLIKYLHHNKLLIIKNVYNSVKKMFNSNS
jgi:hypothetical protein